MQGGNILNAVVLERSSSGCVGVILHLNQRKSFRPPEDDAKRERTCENSAAIVWGKRAVHIEPRCMMTVRVGATAPRRFAQWISRQYVDPLVTAMRESHHRTDCQLPENDQGDTYHATAGSFNLRRSISVSWTRLPSDTQGPGFGITRPSWQMRA